MPRHYLDHASTSPTRPQAVDALVDALGVELSADPGRVYTEGRIARALVEEARERVADLMGARPRQVVFTAGGTEAANWAVWAATRARPGQPVACAAVEHSCVREASARAAEVVDLPVDREGHICVDALEALLSTTPVALVNCQWANHEVGTLQPVQRVVELCREHGVLSHVDAAAAAGHVEVDTGALGADLVSVSGHKMGAPKGVGALVLRPGLRIDPLMVGGEQERSRRAGLENTPAITGFGAAADTLCERGAMQTEADRARRQTGRVLELVSQMQGIEAYGDTTVRLPHVVCLGIDGVVAEGVVLALDQAGIAVHSGSACSSEALVPSPVLEAMGVPADQSLRVSVGWSTDDADVDALVEALPAVVDNLRSLRGEW